MSASPSDNNDPEDPKILSGEKKKKIRKHRRQQRRRSKEAKAITTSKIVVNLPEFRGKDLSEFAESFCRFLRMGGQTRASRRVKCDLLLQCCKTKYLQKQVKQIVTMSTTFPDVPVASERQYPSYETDLSIRTQIQNPAMLHYNPKAAPIFELLANLDHCMGRLTRRRYGSNELAFRPVSKAPKDVWDEYRTTAESKARTLKTQDLLVPLGKLALEKESDQEINAYCPWGGTSGDHDGGYQGPRPSGQGQTPKNAR